MNDFSHHILGMYSFWERFSLHVVAVYITNSTRLLDHTLRSDIKRCVMSQQCISPHVFPTVKMSAVKVWLF